MAIYNIVNESEREKVFELTKLDTPISANGHGIGTIYISIMYMVDCSRCYEMSNYAEFDSKREAIKHFKSEGWTFKNKKWICPKCSRTKITASIIIKNIKKMKDERRKG